MATVSDITITPLSGLNHIDALLDTGPDWNFLTSNTANTLYYTFSVSSGNEGGRTGQEAFTLAQQSAARYAFNYLQQVTGIKFVETSLGTSAQIHLANLDISGTSTTGLCSWSSNYSFTGDKLNSYSANSDMDKFSLAQIAEFFTQLPEYQELYLKDDPSNSHFVTLLYQHVLHREPEKAGFDHWMWTLNENKLTRPEVMAFFAESPENKAQVIAEINNGVEYIGTPT